MPPLTDDEIRELVRHTFNTALRGTWLAVTGWEYVRGRDAKGGANQIRELAYTGPVLCPSCASARQHGAIPGQTGLL